jgi:hypothetical protein
MVDYVKHVLLPNYERAEKTLLVMDSCRTHLTLDVKDILHSHIFDVAVIPGGCTKYLQPLDLTVNRSFKANLRKKVDKCRVKGVKGQMGRNQWMPWTFRIQASKKSLNDICKRRTVGIVVYCFKSFGIILI